MTGRMKTGSDPITSFIFCRTAANISAFFITGFFALCYEMSEKFDRPSEFFAGCILGKQICRLV